MRCSSPPDSSSGVPRDRAGAGELERHRPDAPCDVRAEELAERATGPGRLARLEFVAGLASPRATCMVSIDQICISWSRTTGLAIWPVGSAALRSMLELRLVDLAGAGATDGDALVHEHRGGQVPAVVEFADQPVLRDADVGEEHLVEVASRRRSGGSGGSRRPGRACRR